MPIINCIDCIYWEGFDEGVGYCTNAETVEDLTDDTAGCSLGERE